MLEQAIVVSVRVKGLQDVVGNTSDDGVDLEPVTEGLILLFVEMPELLVLDGLQLLGW